MYLIVRRTKYVRVVDANNFNLICLKIKNIISSFQNIVDCYLLMRWGRWVFDCFEVEQVQDESI